MCIDGKPCLFLLEKYKKSCLSIKCLKYQTMLQKKILITIIQINTDLRFLQHQEYYKLS